MARTPKAEISITAESRTLAGKLREARAQFSRFGEGLKKEVFGKQLMRGVWGEAGAHMVGNLGARAVGAGFSFFEEQAKGVLNFNSALLRFQLAARRTPEEAQAIGASVRQIAAETGLASQTVLAGAQAFVDLAGAENFTTSAMRAIARSAQAGNTEIGAMATVAYSLQNALHIKPDELEATLSGLINQSKDGTIHFANMAEEIIAVAPKFARFGVTGREGAAELGAMFQVVRSGFKDSAETATGLEGMFKGLTRHAPQFKKAGVNVMNIGKDGTKTLKPFVEIWDQLQKSKLMKDPSKLIKAFGRGEGEAAFRLLVEQKDKYNELVEAGRDNETVQRDLATVTESAGGRINIAMEKMKNAVADAFTPDKVEAFTHAIEGTGAAVAGVAKAIGAVSDVGTGLAMVFGGKSAADQVTETRANRMRERAAFLRTTYGDRVADPEEREARIRRELALEQQVQTDLNTQIQGGKISRVVLNRVEGPMPEGVSRQAFVNRGNYSVAELHALRGVMRGTSDEAMSEKLIDLAVAKAMKAQAAELGAIGRMFFGAATRPIEVKADGKAIVDVHRGSSAHARRPGG